MPEPDDEKARAKERSVFSYTFSFLGLKQLGDPLLIKSLCCFYNEAIVKEKTKKTYTPEEFSSEFLLGTLQSPGGKIVLARRNDGQVCGFLAGYFSDFNQNNFLLETPVPKGAYFFMFGLSNTTQDIKVLLGLTTTLLENVEAEYCFCSVSHQAPIYQKNFYPIRGWTEVKSSLPLAKDKSYFYIPREKVIRNPQP